MEQNQVRANITNVPINEIRPNPRQPRLNMDKQALDELAISIKRYGLIQPIVVRHGNEGYELIAGERRLRACKEIGMSEVPAWIMYVSGTDSAVLALIENIQRENLNYIEEGEAFLTLISEHGLTQEELAECLGKNQSTIANKIRILKLPSEIRQMMLENHLTERHARSLLRLNNDKERLRVLKIIIKRGLNVSKSEELIQDMLDKKNDNTTPEPKKLRIFKDIRIFTNTIRQAIDLMKQSGIEAETHKKEDDKYIEYLIKIPKAIV